MLSGANGCAHQFDGVLLGRPQPTPASLAAGGAARLGWRGPHSGRSSALHNRRSLLSEADF